MRAHAHTHTHKHARTQVRYSLFETPLPLACCLSPLQAAPGLPSAPSFGQPAGYANGVCSESGTVSSDGSDAHLQGVLCCQQSTGAPPDFRA
eukprot:58111-Pelagomonas_calceolata.AAC.1